MSANKIVINDSLTFLISDENMPDLVAFLNDCNVATVEKIEEIDWEKTEDPEIMLL